MSVSDQASNDLKLARITIHKLTETFKQLQSHSLSILTLSDQWQNLQNSFAKANDLIENRVKELEVEKREIDATKNRLQNLQKEVEFKRKELDLEEKSLSERIKDVEIRERQVKDWCESLNLEKSGIVERIKAVELREKRFAEGFERVRVEERRKAVEDAEERLRAVEEREDDLRRKREEAYCEREKELKENVENMELREKVMREKGEELNAREKEMNVGENNLDVREKDVYELSEEVKLKEGELNRRFVELELKEANIEEKRKELEVKKSQMDKFYNEIDSLEKEMNEKGELLVSKEKMLELREEQVKEQMKELELKGKELNEQDSHISELKYDAHQMGELIENKQSHEHCKSVLSNPFSILDPYFQNMDAIGLRPCLITIVKGKLRSIYDEVILDGLRCAPDPAKLVLYVCQSFEREYPDKNQTIENKDSCIYLLEQFIKLSFPIEQDVKDEAKHFASSFWDSLKRPGGNTAVNNFGFLLFVAAFDLSSCYNAQELLSLFGQFYTGNEVYRHEQQASLCCALGLSTMIPGVINSLIKKKKLLTAIRYVCAFKLESDFPLVPLLEAYMDLSKKRVNAKLSDGTLKSKIQAERMELSFLRDVNKCIKTFKTEANFPPDFLISRINELETGRKGFNKRGGSESLCSSITSPKQRQKRPRVENVHPDVREY